MEHPAPPLTQNPLWTRDPAGAPADETCRSCVWRFHVRRRSAADPGDTGERCHRFPREPISLDWPACPAWTAAVDCGTCGACCREAYHAVEVSARDPFLVRHSALIERDGRRRYLPRPDGRCVCLGGEPGAWSCTTYADRPRSCRDFEAGGLNCVEARRRVGLTR